MMINVYRDGFKPFKPSGSPTTQAPSKTDFQVPSIGGEPSRIRQAVVNTVIRQRGNQTSKFQPLLTHNPLQRQFLGGVTRTSELPRGVTLEGPDYNFREINQVLSMDGFAARAMRTLISATLKGYRGKAFTLESYSPAAKRYVQSRLDEMTFSVDGTGSIDNLMRKIIISFVTKSNVILWLQRHDRGKSRKSYKWQGRMHNEIRALEVVDPAIVDVARSSDTQRVTGFRVRTGGTDEVVTFSDCYLLKWEDMRQDNLFAQPIITPVLDDILVLRRIEEIHELAMGKATFPLVHVAIGDPSRDPKLFGTQGVDSEITRTKEILEEQAPEGFLVTPYYYDVKIVQPKNMADFLPYMQYYRDRIIVGLNMDGPSMGLGDTSNRNTATSMSEQLIEKVRDIRSAIAEELNRTLIREILWEGGYMPIGETAVYLVWEDPDPSVKRDTENHNAGLYVSGVLTLTEARANIGYGPLTPADEKDLFQLRSEEAKAKFNETKNQPQNQHGKSSSKPARSKRKDSVEAAISALLIRAQDACRKSPASASGILHTHFAIMEREFRRYKEIDTDGQIHKRLQLTKTNLLNKVRDANNNLEVTQAFDFVFAAMSAWLDELEEQSDNLIQDSLVEPEPVAPVEIEDEDEDEEEDLEDATS